MSADIPTRFLILIIGNEGFTNELHEVGRCFGTLMSDDVFRGVAYKATKAWFNKFRSFSLEAFYNMPPELFSSWFVESRERDKNFWLV